VVVESGQTVHALPVLVGSVLAWSEGALVAWFVLVVTLLCALSIQVGTNLFNDVGDALRGNDGPDRVGPQRVTAAGLASPRQVGRVLGLASSSRVALAMECGIQNSALGITLAVSVLAAPQLAVPSVIYALLMNVTAFSVIG
jgi:1,4-dihydroxy-2-naphthoate octaprenyltransferase